MPTGGIDQRLDLLGRGVQSGVNAHQRPAKGLLAAALRTVAGAFGQLSQGGANFGVAAGKSQLAAQRLNFVQIMREDQLRMVG